MITALSIVVGSTYLILLFLLHFQARTHRKDREFYKAQISDLFCQLNARSIGEYAAASEIVNPAPVKALSKKDAKDFEALKFQQAKEDNDEYQVG